jgi:hypothetical protein
MKIINLTPHTIKELTSNITFIPNGAVARIDEDSIESGSIGAIPLFTKQYRPIKNLPAPQPDTYYLVNGIVLDQAKQQGRTDCVAPGMAVRDAKGNIIGCNGFTI